MNIVRRIVVATAGVVVVALVLALAEPKAVHAVVSALVTVSNGPGNPVPTMAVDTRNVNVVNTPVPVTGNINANVTGSVNATLTGTPSVNVSGMPAVNVASVSGNVPVTNPLDGSGNPIPLGVQTDESSPVELSCQQSFSSGSSVASCSPSFTVPSGELLIIDDVSLIAGLSSGQPSGSVIVFFPFGNNVNFFLPLDAQGSTFGLNVFVAAQRTHIYSVASEPVSCAITASTAQTPPAEMQCVIVGHLVPAN
ncbi:MAG TPA: hypothetical protein VFD93_11720 [Candidatus Acidoferrales bacterium]|jgi:hypothetical protein|nr:hypothetical protein [Candidatus Acidoferrales bacterium]